MGPGPPTSGPTVTPGTDVGTGGAVVVGAVVGVLVDAVDLDRSDDGPSPPAEDPVPPVPSPERVA
ncbi:MAG TPA: hypothetical protein PKA87_12740, partial [Microthrixaceae bacterium]|nr:hypothetical protein [Microthrixaceae bacterium]